MGNLGMASRALNFGTLKVSGRLQLGPTYPVQKISWCSLNRKLVETQSRLGRFCKEAIPLHLPQNRIKILGRPSANNVSQVADQEPYV
jgi:hypothetical protein